MTDIRATSHRLLKSYGIALNEEDLNRIMFRFVDEMEKGLTSAGSSLPMLPSYLETEKPVPAEKPVIVVDAGGTNLRVCSVKFESNGACRISNVHRTIMPGAREEISARKFYRSICDFIEPVVHLSDRIGFCFSYPAEITDRIDGRLLFWTKEIKVPEVVGTYIGEGLVKTLKERGIGGKKVVVLNDTVATLLAGKTKGQSRGCESYIGFILGTGTNTAYIEQNAKIGKICPNQGSQAVNVESGGFSACRQGVVDKLLDRSTETPGIYPFEKMISGVYLGPLVWETIKTATADGCFSFKSAELRGRAEPLETAAVSRFLENPQIAENRFGLHSANESDLELLYRLARGVVRRAGQLAAVNMAAAMLKTGKGRSPLHPICVNIDGSTYHKLFGFKQIANGVLDDLLLEREVYYYPVQVEHSPTIGAAIAGLSV